jgi:hypothetical protein
MATMPGVARLQPRGSVAAAAAVLPPRRGWKPLYHRRGRKPLRGAVARAQAAVEIGTTFATRCGLTADACQPARMRQLREKHGSCAARAESAPAMLLGTVEEEAAVGGGRRAKVASVALGRRGSRFGGRPITI